MVSKTVPRPANRCSRRSSRRNRSSRLAASFLAVSIAQIAPAAAQLEASRRPCVGASKPTPATGAHLQLSWDSCDYAQNPLDPYWIDPNTAPGARPARRSLAPGTTGKECDSFPFVHGELHLPSKCISPSAWVSVPDRGIRKLSCNRLRYFPDLLKLLFPERELYGHANLSVVALSGKIQFLEKASPDQDYNFALFPNGAGAPLTDQNPKVDGRAFVSLEFFAPESVDTFQGPWWRGLEEAVRLGRSEDPHWTSARRYVGDVDGYAVGLFGLDCQHGCATELHPVYGLALRGRDPPGPGQDRWAFFARNSGTEGFCSDGRQIDLGLEYLALVLSAPSNPAAGYEIVAADVRRHPTDARVGWTIFPVQEGAVVLVRFPRGDPTYQFLEGEVTLRWK